MWKVYTSSILWRVIGSKFIRNGSFGLFIIEGNSAKLNKAAFINVFIKKK